MAAPMVASLPPGIELGGGAMVQFAALDPVTGAVVAAVTISDATIQVNNLSDSALSNLETGRWYLVPERGP